MKRIATRQKNSVLLMLFKLYQNGEYSCEKLVWKISYFLVTVRENYMYVTCFKPQKLSAEVLQNPFPLPPLSPSPHPPLPICSQNSSKNKICQYCKPGTWVTGSRTKTWPLVIFGSHPSSYPAYSTYTSAYPYRSATLYMRALAQVLNGSISSNFKLIICRRAQLI
jgi:hypothetical protein